MKTTRTVIFSVLFSLALALPALAAVPTTLSYQGTLTDKAGNPITATRTVVFSLYNVAGPGGTNVWTEEQTLTVTGGRFGAILGITTPLDVSMLSGDTWLGIAVQGEPEMTPRQKLTSVAYAMKAGVAESVSNTDSIIPPGTVMAYGGTTIPSGWLLCDGRAVSRTTYSRLYSAISNAHGYGDNSTTFNIPDYRGRFLRGVDYTPNFSDPSISPNVSGSGRSGLDPDYSTRTAMKTGGNPANNVGSVQGDTTKPHTHSISPSSHSHDRNSYGAAEYILSSNGPASAYSTWSAGSFRQTNGVTDTGSTTLQILNNTGSSESRPENAYVNWIIKY